VVRAQAKTGSMPQVQSGGDWSARPGLVLPLLPPPAK